MISAAKCLFSVLLTGPLHGSLTLGVRVRACPYSGR